MYPSSSSSGDTADIFYDHTSTQNFYREGSFQDKKVIKSYKPLFVALAIIGLLSMGVVGGTGIANLGNHLNWWPAAGFNNLSQTGAIAMVASGGGAGLLLIIGGLIGLRKNTPRAGSSELKPESQPVEAQPLTLSDAKSRLTNGSYTWFLQDNLYTLIIKKFPKVGATEGEIVERAIIQMQDMSRIEYGEGLYDYTFIKTSPMPMDLTISVEDLKTRLTDSTFTFVLQRNDRYALCANNPQEQEFILNIDLPTDELVSLGEYYRKYVGLSFVETSPLPARVTEGLATVSQQGYKDSDDESSIMSDPDLYNFSEDDSDSGSYSETSSS